MPGTVVEPRSATLLEPVGAATKLLEPGAADTASAGNEARALDAEVLEPTTGSSAVGVEPGTTRTLEPGTKEPEDAATPASETRGVGERDNLGP